MKNKLSVSLTSTEKVLGWVYWALQLLFLPAAISIVLSFLGHTFSDIQQNFIFFSCNFIFLTVIFGRFLWQSVKDGLQHPFLVMRAAFLGYALYWLCSLVIGFAITRFQPDFANANDSAIFEMAADNYALTAIGTVLLAPVAEELLYRGVIFGSLYHRSRVAAFLVSTLGFALVHVVGYIGLYDLPTLALCLVQYLPAGVCLGWAYARSGNIWAPILMHIAINQTSILTMR